VENQITLTGTDANKYSRFKHYTEMIQEKYGLDICQITETLIELTAKKEYYIAVLRELHQGTKDLTDITPEYLKQMKTSLENAFCEFPNANEISYQHHDLKAAHAFLFQIQSFLKN
jgi:formaldehyde-activating enzyme involved in methanogenesis